MTPEQGRAEWQMWASRVDEVRSDLARYKAMDLDIWANRKPGTSYLAQSISEAMQTFLERCEKHRDALSEYAPKETP